MYNVYTTSSDDEALDLSLEPPRAGGNRRQGLNGRHNKSDDRGGEAAEAGGCFAAIARAMMRRAPVNVLPAAYRQQRDEEVEAGKRARQQEAQAMAKADLRTLRLMREKMVQDIDALTQRRKALVQGAVQARDEGNSSKRIALQTEARVVTESLQARSARYYDLCTRVAQLELHLARISDLEEAVLTERIVEAGLRHAGLVDGTSIDAFVAQADRNSEVMESLRQDYHAPYATPDPALDDAELNDELDKMMLAESSEGASAPNLACTFSSIPVPKEVPEGLATTSTAVAPPSYRITTAALREEYTMTEPV